MAEREGSTAELAPATLCAERRVRGFRIRVIDGPDAGQWFAGPRIVVGTHPSADLVLRDRTVSRFHCELVVTDKGPTVRDLGSRNGVGIQGVSVLHATIEPGSTVTVGKTRLMLELDEEQLVPTSRDDRFGDLVGSSIVMRSVFAQLARAAAGDVTTLLTGETGTGKELAARAVHDHGARRKGPFVVVDCGAIPASLLEAELFGHERGAFSGATATRAGAFEAAAGGTVFLDEIGELTLATQPALLRVLERCEVRRVGSNHYRRVDVRIVAATNRDLRAEVNAGRFRSDLYFRIAVLDIRMPPLREHLDDLPLVVRDLLSRMSATSDERRELLAPSRLRELGLHSWPGNVRELRNHLERLRAAGPGVTPPLDEGGESEEVPFRVARLAFERQYLDAILRAHEGNVTAAARAAGIDRIHLYRLLWRHGLR